MTPFFLELDIWLPIIAPAWAAASLLVLLSAPLGCLVLWRRMAFFADTLAHGALFGAGVASVLALPLGVGIGFVSAALVGVFSVLKDRRLPTDAILSAVATTLLCLGLLVLTQLTQKQGNVLGFLFGNLLDMAWTQVGVLAGAVAFGLVWLFLIWQNQIKLATSAPLAALQGISAVRARLLFMALLAAFCAWSLDLVGSLLISGLLILPPMTARLFAKTPTQMAILATLFGQIAVTVGVWVSVWLDIGTGVAIVLTAGMGFFGGFITVKLQRLGRQKYDKKRLKVADR